MDPVTQLGGFVLRLAAAACAMCTLATAVQAGQAPREPENTFVVAQAGGKKGYCTSYAKRAVKAQERNQREGCRFRGARWQSNYDNHFNWCMRVPRSAAESESRARQQQLQTCKRRSSGGTNEGYCNAYAKRAVNAHKQNVRNRCGFRGARWHGNYDRHYQWCLRVPKNTAESESKGRQQQLKGCK